MTKRYTWLQYQPVRLNVIQCVWRWSHVMFGLLSERWKIWLNYESMSLQLNCSRICKKQISHHHIWSLISYLEKLWYLKTNFDSFGNWTAAVSETMKVTTEVWHLVMKVKNVPYLLCLVLTNQQNLSVFNQQGWRVTKMSFWLFLLSISLIRMSTLSTKFTLWICWLFNYLWLFVKIELHM